MSSGDHDSAEERAVHPSPDETKDSAAQVAKSQWPGQRWNVSLPHIAAVLFMLLIVLAPLPLVNGSREAERRAVCQNNIRNLGIAIASYESQRRAYPGYRDSMTVNTSLIVGGVQTNKVPVNWFIMLIPNLERGNIFRNWKFMSGVDIPDQGPVTYKFPTVNGEAISPFKYMELMVCPSDPQSPAPIGQPQSTSYIANSGLQDVPASTTTPADWPENGVFLSRWEMPQPAGQPQLVTATNNADSISRGDGVSSTVMLTENVEARFYSDVFLHVGQPGDLGSPTRPVSEQMTCFVWFPQDPLPADRQQMKINGLPTGPSPDKVGKNPSPGIAHDITYARPSSNHPGGANFVFCDTHTKFITDDIDNMVYIMLMTSNGAGARNPGTETPLPKSLHRTPLDEGFPY